MFRVSLFETVECLIEVSRMHAQPGVLDMTYVRPRRLRFQQIGCAPHEPGIVERLKGKCGDLQQNPGTNDIEPGHTKDPASAHFHEKLLQLAQSDNLQPSCLILLQARRAFRWRPMTGGLLVAIRQFDQRRFVELLANHLQTER